MSPTNPAGSGMYATKIAF